MGMGMLIEQLWSSEKWYIGHEWMKEARGVIPPRPYPVLDVVGAGGCTSNIPTIPARPYLEAHYSGDRPALPGFPGLMSGSKKILTTPS